MELYTGYMTAAQLWSLVYTLPKSKDKPNELERKLSQTKANAIRDYIQEPENLMPNNIIINLDKVDFIDVKSLDGGDDAYHLTFKPITEQVEGDDGETELPNKIGGKYGYVVDGQHRGYGIHLSNVAGSMMLPVTAMWNAPKEVAYKTFADINEEQTKVPKLLTLFIRHEIEKLGVAETQAFEVTEALNNDGPLQGKIRFFQDEKGTFVNSPAFVDAVESITTGVLGHLRKGKDKGTAAIVAILNDYFRAIQAVWPAAWGSKTHVLTKAMGIDLMLKSFERVYRRCDFYEAGQHEFANFKRQLQELAKVKLTINSTMGEEMQVPLNWESDIFGGYSSGKGKTWILNQIMMEYPERP
ncbi:MAG: DGQHR domain-containing protein [Nitrososphaerota archaeon]|nr:DGQHR domain-containing protein [Nitrososphaerota archaeon]